MQHYSSLATAAFETFDAEFLPTARTTTTTDMDFHSFVRDFTVLGDDDEDAEDIPVSPSPSPYPSTSPATAKEIDFSPLTSTSTLPFLSPTLSTTSSLFPPLPTSPIFPSQTPTTSTSASTSTRKTYKGTGFAERKPPKAPRLKETPSTEKQIRDRESATKSRARKKAYVALLEGEVERGLVLLEELKGKVGEESEKRKLAEYRASCLEAQLRLAGIAPCV